MTDFSLCPEDVLINILLRLPIKYVFRSKSVCKNWNSVLQSSIFGSLYYDHQLCRQERLVKDGVSSFIILEYVENESFAKRFPSSNNKQGLYNPYLKEHCGWYDEFDGEDDSFECAYVLLSFVTLRKMNNELITTVDRVEKLYSLLTSVDDRLKAKYPRFSNVYDGIICLEDDIGVLLYNPYSRESQRLPFYPCTHPMYYHVVLGVWLEPGTIKHYKIFSLLVLGDMRQHTYVIEKYDSIENSWTKIKTMPNRRYSFKRYNCLLFNEILHLYDDPYSDSLITLEIKSETLGLLPLPSGIPELNIGPFSKLDIISHGKSHFIGSCFAPHIFVLGGSLAMFAKNNDTLASCTDIWIMTEYGVKESWTKQYTICEEYIRPSDFYQAPLVEAPLCWKLLLNWKCMDEDQMILETRNINYVYAEQYLEENIIDPRRKLVSFNLFSNKLTEIDMFLTGDLVSVIPCIETIISLK